MRVIGVDTDSKGSLAVIDDVSKTVTIFYVPSFKRELENGKRRSTLNRKVIAQYSREIFTNTVDVAYVEEQWSRPDQDAGSTFTFGCIYCALVQALASAAEMAKQDTNIVEVHSRIWKHALGLSADKDEARALAAKIFPNAAPAWKLKEHTSAAEALLIAMYGYVKESKVKVNLSAFKDYTLILPANRRVTLTDR